jgi:2-iminobutanoate/2-iminopropanoate deaminase
MRNADGSGDTLAGGFGSVKLVSGAPNAPAAIGPYSQAAIIPAHAKIAYLSGQVPLDPTSGAIVSGGIEAQTTQVLKNLSAVLSHLGVSFEAVVKSTIFLTDMNDFAKVNTLYEQALGAHKPARATVQVSGLPKGAAIEIEMIAVVA